MAKTVPLVRCTLTSECLLPTSNEEMEEMFLRLGFSQTVAIKLVDDQGIDSPWTLASLSDEDIAAVCNVICRPCRLVRRKTLVRGNQISILVTKSLKLTALMLTLL